MFTMSQLSTWPNWFLVEFLEFKKDDILAGLSKTTVHHAGLRMILESQPPEDISIALMKQLTQKIYESEEVREFFTRY